MSEAERGLIIPAQPEIDSRVEYRDWARSPMTIVRQTHAILGLVMSDIPNVGPAREYLHDYTLGYLRNAEAGADELFDQRGFVQPDLDPEVREAPGHAFTVFGYLPDMTKSRFLPMGFSRRGMLGAPQTRSEFLKRLNELKANIWRIADRQVNPQVIFESDRPLLRTVNFFRVGSELPIHLSDSEHVQDQLEREKFNDFLGGMNIDL